MIPILVFLAINLTQPYNLTCIFSNNTAATAINPLACIPQSITYNFPWFFPLTLLFFCAAMYIVRSRYQEDTKHKFLVSTFLTFVLACLYQMFGMYGPTFLYGTFPVITFSIFLVVLVWSRATA